MGPLSTQQCGVAEWLRRLAGDTALCLHAALVPRPCCAQLLPAQSVPRGPPAGPPPALALPGAGSPCAVWCSPHPLARSPLSLTAVSPQFPERLIPSRSGPELMGPCPGKEDPCADGRGGSSEHTYGDSGQRGRPARLLPLGVRTQGLGGGGQLRSPV